MSKYMFETSSDKEMLLTLKSKDLLDSLHAIREMLRAKTKYAEYEHDETYDVLTSIRGEFWNILENKGLDIDTLSGD